MLFQDQSLPFDYSFGIPMIIFWLITFVFCLLLLDAKMMSKKIRISIFLITIIFGGIWLGGIPNAVMPIQQVLTTIGLRTDFSYLLPAIIIVNVLLATSLIVGRVFCGFACPIGALQELISKLNFKTDLKAQKKAKFRIEVSTKLSNKVRWIFLGILFFSASIWSLIILPEFNPLSGFSVFRSPDPLTLIIPFIALILVSVASFFLYRPWCRFLCPFGAGSSLLTRAKLQHMENCTDCGVCEKICPTQEAIKESKKGECYLCYRCVEACPNNAIIFNIG
jgi:polyferredoxin